MALAGAIVPGVARSMVMLSAHADVLGVGITAMAGAMLVVASCVMSGWIVPGGGHAAFDVLDKRWTYAVYRTYFERLASYAEVAAAAAAYALAFGQRALSSPARVLRRKTRSVTGTLTLHDGSEQELDEPVLLIPLETALRAFSWGVVLLGLGLVASKLI